jgi:hypothetical protein
MFSWFKKSKNNNEENIQIELSRFEQYNERQQSRLDEANQALITSLNQAQINQSSLQNDQIERLKKDVEYYRQQITKQQSTIEELSGRYDAVMGCLLEEKRKDIKDIFSDDDFIRIQPSELISEHVSNEKTDPQQTQINNSEEISISVNTSENATESAIVSNEASVTNTTSTTNKTKEAEVKVPFKEDDLLFDQAILQRKTGDSEQAFLLFEQAAKQGHIKAMGAMGRSFFLGEGTPEDHSLGLAWLINAANHNLPQALNRVKHFQESDPELYKEALELSEKLA